jgi:hypothetical protein
MCGRRPKIKPHEGTQEGGKHQNVEKHANKKQEKTGGSAIFFRDGHREGLPLDQLQQVMRCIGCLANRPLGWYPPNYHIQRIYTPEYETLKYI